MMAMKHYPLLILLCTLAVLVGCKEKISPNQKLFNEVMDIHDEVMPKMNDIHKIKTGLREKMANNPDMPEEEKKETNAMIARLDSAGESMMAWMREFDPLPDSAGEETARRYLENEKIRIIELNPNEVKKKHFVDAKTLIAVQWAQLKGLL